MQVWQKFYDATVSRTFGESFEGVVYEDGSATITVTRHNSSEVLETFSSKWSEPLNAWAWLMGTFEIRYTRAE